MKLTPKKRLLNTINRKVIDKLPSVLWISKYVKNNLLNEIASNEEELLEILDNHMVVVSSLDNHWAWDKKDSFETAIKRKYIKLSTNGKIVYDNWGVGWNIEQEGIFWSYHPLKNKNDLRKYTFPSLEDSHLFDFLKLDKEKYGKKYCIAAMQDNTLFERAYSLRGYENFLVDLKVDKSFAENLLDKIMEHEIERAKKFVELNVDCVITGDDFGTQENLIMSVEDWKTFMMPRLKQIWNVYIKNYIPIIHHSCGNIIDLIPYMIDMGLDVLHPIQHVMPPKVLKKQFGKDLIFFGGIDSQNLITFGTKEEITNEVKRLITILGEDGGYIVSLDQNIMSNVPINNILILVEAIKKYAGLPFN